MPVKKILLLGNELLRKKSSRVHSFDTALTSLTSDLLDTLRNFQNNYEIGRAIAAPQIGVLKQVIAMETPERQIIMVNPKITQKSEELFDVWDSCFCFKVAFFVNIKRHREITIDYQTLDGKHITETFIDDLSELFQHEIDHLHGVLCTDHLKNPKNIIMREEWEGTYRKPS
ncbi:MAG: peptide deformylase [Asgard group archaeon]|nr:peptide deformylase [Asgard group archaeon]